MSEDKGVSDSILAIFVITILVFLFLEGTIFYEPPSCVTSNVDPFEFILPLFLSGIIAVLIYLGLVELFNKINEWIK